MAAEFVVYEAEGMFRWYLRAPNGDVIVRHEHAYASREDAESAIRSVIDCVPSAIVVEAGEPPDDEAAADARRSAYYHQIVVENQRKLKELAARLRRRSGS
jgi:uncharacterized protein YegP (UPF0339 family)